MSKYESEPVSFEEYLLRDDLSDIFRDNKDILGTIQDYGSDAFSFAFVLAGKFNAEDSQTLDVEIWNSIEPVLGCVNFITIDEHMYLVYKDCTVDVTSPNTPDANAIHELRCILNNTVWDPHSTKMIAENS